MIVGRTLLLAAVFGALGAATLVRGTAKGYNIDEAWIERTYPSSVGAFSMAPSADGSKGHSYKMDDTTYQALQAYGIVGRTLSDGKTTYDVVVIAGDQPNTFHNPIACFGAQEWKVVEDRLIELATKSRGTVHAHMTKAEKGGEIYTAIYTFEGPDATYDNNGDLISDLFTSQFKSGRIQPATFFRFMGKTGDGGDPAMEEFAIRYLDSSPVRPILHA